MTLQEQLKQVMEAQGLTASAVARSLGISASALSQWLDDKYAGNVSRIDRAVNSFLRRQQERARLPRFKQVFVETSVVHKVWEVFRLCHLDGEIGVIVGEAGVGKTVAAREYARQNPDVIFVEADLGYTARSLFHELARHLGFMPSGTIHDVFEDVVERLRGSERLIIVDEAEHLPYRALELLRRVYDKAGVGIVLMGMPRLLANLRGHRGEYRQLYSRVGIYASVERISLDDATAIVEAVVPGANGLSKAFWQNSHGNTRVLTKLVKRALRIASINDRPLDAEVVKAAAKTLII